MKPIMPRIMLIIPRIKSIIPRITPIILRIKLIILGITPIILRIRAIILGIKPIIQRVIYVCCALTTNKDGLFNQNKKASPLAEPAFYLPV